MNQTEEAAVHAHTVPNATNLQNTVRERIPLHAKAVRRKWSVLQSAATKERSPEG